MTERQKWASFVIGIILIEAISLLVIYQKIFNGSLGLALPPLH